MGNRVFVAVVICLWASSMSWLMMEKVLPAFFRGEPPHPGAKLNEQPIVWKIECNDEPVGLVVSQAIPGILSTTEVHSRIRLDRIPLREMVPQWMRGILAALGSVGLDARHRVAFDSLGTMTSFDTRMQINGAAVPVRVSGRVRGDQLKVKLRTGDVSHDVSYTLPENYDLSSELTPDAKMLQIYVGRRWAQEIYNPLRPPNDAIDVVHAEVVAEEAIFLDGEMRKARRVEYRSPPSPGVSSSDTLRSVVWVAEDGTVLRQELYMMQVRLRFDRELDEDTLAEAATLLDLASVATNPIAPVNLPNRD